MKTSIASRTRVAARVGVTLTAFAAFGCAADDPGAQKAASVSASLPIEAATAGATPHCDARAAAHKVSLQDPQGAALELAYVPGCGWQYTGGKGARGTGTAVSAIHPISSSHAAADEPENPLAVYIDGPTGYAFAWTRDRGWKFIGHMDERKTQ